MSYNNDWEDILEHSDETEEVECEMICDFSVDNEYEDDDLKELMESFFENISQWSFGAYSHSMRELIKTPNISQDLFDRAVKYVLSVDKEYMLKDGRFAFEEMYDTIDNVLVNPKTSKEFADKLKELKNELESLETKI